MKLRQLEPRQPPLLRLLRDPLPSRASWLRGRGGDCGRSGGCFFLAFADEQVASEESGDECLAPYHASVDLNLARRARETANALCPQKRLPVLADKREAVRATDALPLHDSVAEFEQATPTVTVKASNILAGRLITNDILGSQPTAPLDAQRTT